MDNIIKLNADKQDRPCNEANDLISIADEMLFDIRTELPQGRNLSVPIAQLSTLGAGVASLLPALRTVTQSAEINTTNIYHWVNEGAGNVLKVAKNGNQWGAYKTATGTSKMAQFQAAGPLSTTSTTTLPVNIVAIVMAVALYSLEKQLSNIAEMQREILSFLETEKESEIEADIETLSNIINKYKHNWDNDQFVSSNHKMVLDIQRTSRKHMISYQKRVRDTIKDRKILVLQSKVKNTLEEMIKDFKYYRLSLFAFSMSSLIEIMLSGNFKEENILEIKEEIQKLAFDYREVFDECSVYLEDLEKSSVESNVLKGVSATSKAVGKFIGSIPKIKDGQIDEFLQDSGEHIKEKAIAIETDSISAFAEMNNPGTSLFTEKMDDLITIYNHTTDICFDDKNIYLIAN